jgi:hypothetical protein
MQGLKAIVETCFPFVNRKIDDSPVTHQTIQGYNHSSVHVDVQSGSISHISQAVLFMAARSCAAGAMRVLVQHSFALPQRSEGTRKMLP